MVVLSLPVTFHYSVIIYLYVDIIILRIIYDLKNTFTISKYYQNYLCIYIIYIVFIFTVNVPSLIVDLH